MKTLKTKHKKSLLRRMTRIHGILTLVVFMLYVVAGSLLDPGIFISDLGRRYSWAANLTTSLRVMGIPTTPVLSGSTDCSGTNARVNLTWNQSQDSDHYDIYRDGSLLINGLTGFAYQDINVQIEANYDYTVMAVGPMGEALSNEIAMTTGECVYVPPAPTCEIRTFAGIDLHENSAEPETTNQMPTITGTTNIANANMHLEVPLAGMSVATGTANNNGYWILTVPVALPVGEYVAIVTAVDPGDSSRRKTVTLSFRIKAEPNIDDDGNDSDHNRKNKARSESSIASQPEQTSVGIPKNSQISQKPQFEMNMVIQNKDGVAYAGGLLLAKVNFMHMNNGADKNPITLRYEILDLNSRIYMQSSEAVNLDAANQIEKKIDLLENMPHGNYILRVKVEKNGSTMSAEAMFMIKERPIINLGAVTITKTDIIKNMALAANALILLLIIFLILLGIERYLIIGTRHIAEQQLRDAGFIKRKGVSQ